MPRKANAPLYQIKPDELANEVTEALEAHLGSLAIALGKSVVDIGPSDLRHSVRVLAHYAINGGKLDSSVHEYMISMLPIWSRASDGPCVQTPEFDDVDKIDPTTWVGQLVLVMRAACGREAIQEGTPVLPADLAVLGGVSPQHVRLLIRKGEIVAQGDGGRWEIAADEAKRWLASRRDVW